ncbi:MAG: MBL fold metallo-hydrolase, partial [Candidatus Pacebacteria bacterium]|nr:MBL fold metallo-hydrolase [Candidatus Paceibacterota bacterium]
MSIKLKNILFIIFAIFFILDVFLVFSFDNQDTVKNSKIIFFDVGQGDSIMIDGGNNMQILIDGGDGNVILDKLGKYMPLLDRKIELVIMTHPDKDHMGGLVEVLKYYQVDQILETGIVCETAICQQWDNLIEEKNIPIKYAEFGQRIKLNDAEIKILYPFENLNNQKVKDDNESSIVLRVDTENNSYLLTGDAGFDVENELTEKDINIETKILKIAHHGSKNATSNEFLRKVNPQKAIIPVGKNSYGHPAEELLNRLKNMNIEFFRTDKRGDLIFNSN